MDLKDVREELDTIDNLIKNLIVLRMSIIPIVTKIKIENNLSIHQPKREEQIYEKIKEFSDKTGVDNTLLKGIYEQIIKSAISIEEKGVQATLEASDEVLEKYKELDILFKEVIPEKIGEIVTLSPENNLSQIATGIFERRIYGN